MICRKPSIDIVATVAERMQTEVCSLYIFDPKKNRLTLCATMGLDPESVGKVSMATGEGLPVWCIERMKPVMVVDALKHPRYKYFPETHEEHFHSFFGVPLFEKKHAARSLGRANFPAARIFPR